MLQIKRNIWLAFYLITLIWCLFFGAAIYTTYQSVYDEHTSEQKNITLLATNSLKSNFNQYGVLLNVISNELLENGFLVEPAAAQKIIDSIIEVDDSMLGVGIFMPNGDAYVASSNIPLPAKFNILTQPENRDTFQQTLDENRMVLGRTYFSNALQSVAFPLRKAVKDENGEVLFVISTVIDIQTGFQYFANNDTAMSTGEIYLYRDRDRYYQIALSTQNIPATFFNHQIPSEKLEGSIRSLEAELGLSLQEIKNGELMVITNSHLPGVHSKVISKYLPELGLWIETKIEDQVIWQSFVNKVIVLLVIFPGSLLLIFALFKSIARSEKKTKDKLEYQARHDHLTRLKNRFFLDQQMGALSDKNPFHLLFVDLDNFKMINDTFGHEFGDKILCEVASRLKKLVHKDDYIIRYSGDEFIVIAFNRNHLNVDDLTRNILERLREPCLIGPTRCALSASIGISKFPNDGSDLDELKRHADMAMYEAKKSRNATVEFQPQYREAYQLNALIEQELKTAVENEEFHLLYQPQICRSGKIHGVEALLRWKNEKLGAVFPDKFIPIAEACGEMPFIGEFVLDRALADIKQIQHETGIGMMLSVNVSVKQFQHEGFSEKLSHIIRKHSFPESQLDMAIEVTESLFIDDMDRILLLLNDIKQKGIRISLDDFGTGYSSLSILNQLPIDELKIDRSFVDKMLTDKNTYAMLEGIFTIANKLNISTVAEGVETAEMWSGLQDLNCDIFQGYYFARPLSKPDLKNYILSFDQKLEHWKEERVRFA